VDNVIILSDNESWARSPWVNPWSPSLQTDAKRAWLEIKKSNPDARLVCVDISPGMTTQVADSKDTLNIGGWSDATWDVITPFLAKQSVNWVAEIKAVTL
jgi:60 kDa SS-A/Ro ribonucleoprotein